MEIKSPEIIQVLKEIYRVTNNVFFLITHSDNRKSLLADVGFEVMKMEQLKNNLRDYYLYFCIKDINEATKKKTENNEKKKLKTARYLRTGTRDLPLSPTSKSSQ